MSGVLYEHFQLPQTFTAVQLDVATTSAMWQLEGYTNIDHQVQALVGMTVPGPGRVTQLGTERLVWFGRDRYFLTTQRQDLHDSDGLYVTNQTYSRAQILIEGEAARHLLARGLPIDVADVAFAVSDVKHSHINHIGVTVIRNHDNAGSPIFELWVMRGFAKSLMDFLLRSAATLC